MENNTEYYHYEILRDAHTPCKGETKSDLGKTIAYASFVISLLMLVIIATIFAL